MSASSILHYIFLGVAAAATLSLLFVRNVFHAALLMIMVLLSLAGLYVLSHADFLALTQILVYAGGILVVMVFAIMLTSPLNGRPLAIEHSNRVAAALAGLVWFAIVAYLLFNAVAIPAPDQPAYFSLKTLGALLMSQFALPFEVTAIVMLVALVGAAVMASPLSRRR